MKYLFAALMTCLSCSSTIPKENKPVVSFGLVADIQYCDCDPVHDRHYRSVLTKLNLAIKQFKQSNVSFVIDLGDVIDHDIQSFDRALHVYNSFERKVYHTLGNHDFEVSVKQKSQVPSRLAMDKRYYDFAVQNWRFIVLDGTDLSFFAGHKDSMNLYATDSMFTQTVKNQRPNAIKWNGGIGSRQFQWLQKKLEEARKYKEKVLVFCHYPVYPEDKHNLWNDRELVSLLEGFPHVVAWFNGHKHEGSYAQKKQVHYVNLQGMVETSDRESFAVVDVYNDKLVINGFGREPSRVLPLN
ncbi:MAG: metallophosphoesterase [Fibrobacteria bacterium]|nr:metallophosphoesterase [Fibrobacteria bacterium]